MAILIMCMFIIIYILEFRYYDKTDLKSSAPIISIILLAIQALVMVTADPNTYSINMFDKDNIFDVIYTISFYIGYFIWSIIAIFISIVPIYKNKNNIDNVFKHYINLFAEKNLYCSRSDYWFFFFCHFLIANLLLLISGLVSSFANNSYMILIIFLFILDLILQIKRFNDANINNKLLLFRLFGLIGYSFAFITTIILIALLCLPTQKVPTTDLKLNDKGDKYD